MNSASFLLCIVFAAIGYVIYPLILPNLVSSDIVSEESLSDSYKKKMEENKVDEDLTKSEEAEVEDDEEVTTSEPVKPSVPDMEVKPEVVVEEIPAEVVPEPTPAPVVVEPAPAPEVVPAPEPAPVVEQPVVSVKLTDAQIIAVLKKSVAAAEVNEFNMNQVLDWKGAGEETINGETYAVGFAIYGAKTIFGDEKLQAKALVKDGKVVKWLWPTTNTEMR